MTKEKTMSLTKHVNEMKNKLTSPTPEKHKNRPENYNRFLENEIKFHTNKLEASALEEAPKK